MKFTTSDEIGALSYGRKVLWVVGIGMAVGVAVVLWSLLWQP